VLRELDRRSSYRVDLVIIGSKNVSCLLPTEIIFQYIAHQNKKQFIT